MSIKQTIHRQPKIAIIGAGVIGLSTATAILEQLPSVEITIFTEKILSETTSIGAAGLFRPEATSSPGDDESAVKSWAQSSYQYFSALARSVNSPKTGIQIVSGYHVSRESYERCLNPLTESIVPFKGRDMSSCELNDLFGSSNQLKYGRTMSTILIDPTYYLKWMLSHLLTKCTLIMKKIHSLYSDDTLDSFDIIVNCTGLGSRQLVPDHNVAPIRGQTIRIKAPWIKHYIYADGVYIIPSSDGYVTLGGIYQFNNNSCLVNSHDRDWIWSSCCQLIPSLNEINENERTDWVGLRPFRGNIRVEVESDCDTPIVHNYGHGGHGITLSRGTAVHAANLVKQLLFDRFNKAKL